MSHETPEQMEALGRAIVEATNVAVYEMQGVFMRLLGGVLALPLSDAEKTHIAGIQVMVVIAQVNDLLSRLDEEHYAAVMRAVHALIEREMVGGTQTAGLARLTALLMPLQPSTTPLN